MPAMNEKFVVTVSVWTDAPTTRKAVKEWVDKALVRAAPRVAPGVSVTRASARKVDKE